MAQLSSDVIDGGIEVLHDDATTIVICSDEPTTFNEADVTYKLGQKVFGTGLCFTAPEDWEEDELVGRKVASIAITDGSVSVTGTATHFAVIDATRLLLRGELSSEQDVTATQTFTLSSFDVIIEAISTS